MIYIAHRGLVNGPNKDLENNPKQIDESLLVANHAEADFWVLWDGFWLGHDKPQYKVDYKWLMERDEKLFIHAKNIQAAEYLALYGNKWHWFWHENDTMTLTNKGFMWVYPGKQPIEGSIAVLPEINDDSCSMCIGICTDYVIRYKLIYQ